MAVSAICFLSVISNAAMAQLEGVPVLGGILAMGNFSAMTALPTFDPLSALSGQSETPVPIVSDILGSEVTSQLISGGVPGLDLILANPMVPMFTPIAGELLQAVSVSDVLEGLAASAP